MPSSIRVSPPPEALGCLPVTRAREMSLPRASLPPGGAPTFGRGLRPGGRRGGAAAVLLLPGPGHRPARHRHPRRNGDRPTPVCRRAACGGHRAAASAPIFLRSFCNVTFLYLPSFSDHCPTFLPSRHGETAEGFPCSHQHAISSLVPKKPKKLWNCGFQMYWQG